MEAYRILFNPLSGSGKGKENAEKLIGRKPVAACIFCCYSVLSVPEPGAFSSGAFSAGICSESGWRTKLSVSVS